MWWLTLWTLPAVAKEPPICEWSAPVDYGSVIAIGDATVVTGFESEVAVSIDREGHTQAVAQNASVIVWGELQTPLLLPQRPVRLGEGIIANWTARLSVYSLDGAKLVVVPVDPPFEPLTPVQAAVECEAIGLEHQDPQRFWGNAEPSFSDPRVLDLRTPLEVRESAGGPAFVRLPGRLGAIAEVLESQAEWSRVRIDALDYIVEGTPRRKPTARGY